MRIWVDADSCPGSVKEILYRAAERKKVRLVLVANTLLRPPPSPYIKSMRVAKGFNVADTVIAEQVEAGDLVITADIPLAAEIIARHAFALNPRGEFYSSDTISERLAMRNFMTELRDGGVITGGPAILNRRDRQAFSNQLDRFLTRYCNS